jgi:hypothetical protein
MRIIVLILSISTLVLYGHALAGLGGYFFEKGRPDLIVTGLLLGTACAVSALVLWRKYLNKIEEELRQGK